MQTPPADWPWICAAAVFTAEAKVTREPEARMNEPTFNERYVLMALNTSYPVDMLSIIRMTGLSKVEVADTMLRLESSGRAVFVAEARGWMRVRQEVGA